MWGNVYRSYGYGRHKRETEESRLGMRIASVRPQERWGKPGQPHHLTHESHITKTNIPSNNPSYSYRYQPADTNGASPHPIPVWSGDLSCVGDGGSWSKGCISSNVGGALLKPVIPLSNWENRRARNFLESEAGGTLVMRPTERWALTLMIGMRVSTGDDAFS
jgi:hypothetical protein